MQPLIQREGSGAMGWPVIPPYPHDSAFGQSFANSNNKHIADTEAMNKSGKTSDLTNANGHNFHQINLNL
jgi:hypothetical protein